MTDDIYMKVLDILFENDINKVLEFLNLILEVEICLYILALPIKKLIQKYIFLENGDTLFWRESFNPPFHLYQRYKKVKEGWLYKFVDTVNC